MTITCTDRFQFHKGTIRTVISITSFLFFANFNSIKVQLELYLHSYLRQSRQNFNSIKVQLEHDSVFRQVFQPLFQFHKGTIRTNLLCSSATTVEKFQFHKGTIRTAAGRD